MPWVTTGVVLNEPPIYLILKINCRQRGYIQFYPDPNLAPGCQEGGSLYRRNAQLWVHLLVYWRSQRHRVGFLFFWWRRRPSSHFVTMESCTISDQSSRPSLRTRQTDFLLCKLIKKHDLWASYSKESSRLPVVIDQCWQSFSPSLLQTVLPELEVVIIPQAIVIVSAVLEGFKDKWEHYYTTKERKHRHSVVGEESILHPHASAMSMSSMKDKMENFLVCSFFFFHPSLYFARRCTFWGSRCMKEVRSRCLVCLAKMSQGVWN